MAGIIGFALVACLGASSPGAARSGSATISHVAWRVAWRASLPYGNDLVSVSATSSRDIWAVGSAHQGDFRGGYLVHWNGRRWRTSRFPAPRFVPGVVSASSPADVWVAGERPPNIATAYRWDGSTWHAVSTPVSAGADTALVALGPANVWMAGGAHQVPGHGVESQVFHWNGSSWASYKLPTGLSDSESIAGSSPRNLWAVGKTPGQFSRPGRLVAYQWTGHSWRSRPIPSRRITEWPEVSVSPSGDVWIEAISTRKKDRHHLTVVLHRHGRRWAAVEGVNQGADPGWPPTADGRDHVWLGNLDYWNGHVLLGAGLPNSCPGGIYTPNLADMDGIPRTNKTAWAATCQRTRNGGFQGMIMISRVR